MDKLIDAVTGGVGDAKLEREKFDLMKAESVHRRETEQKRDAASHDLATQRLAFEREQLQAKVDMQRLASETAAQQLKMQMNMMAMMARRN